MPNILEYNKPSLDFSNSSERAEFISGISDIVASDTYSIEFEKLYFVVLYSKRAKLDEVVIRDYNKRKFSNDFDIHFTLLRVKLNTFIKENYPDCRIAGVDFALIICFGKNHYADLPEYADSRNKNGDGETLNIIPVNPRFTLQQMILSEDSFKDIQDVVTLVKLREKIYDDWGFSEIDPIPRAIINFYGPPGTGKTMAAHALATEFGVKILALNYADIESKYVGDAPKNLVAAFEIAKKHNALLFFDEADSFLGKRISNVTQSADQAVNSLRSQLLMLLEEFNGTVIFATNLIENYDKAFKSRILKHIRFELPTFELRKKLIAKMIPSRMPLEEKRFTDEGVTKLAEISDGFSGREIKNGILNGIVASAKNHDCFIFDDAINGFENVKKTISPQQSISSGDKLKQKLERKIRRALRRKKVKKATYRDLLHGSINGRGRAQVQKQYNEVKVL